MSQILSSILAELGPSTLSQLGASVGASPTQTQSAVAAALPALVAGLAKNTQQPAGANALASALDRDHGPNLMDTLGPLAGMLGGGQGGGAGAAGLLGGLLGGGAAASSGGGAGGGLGALLGALASGASPGKTPPAANGAGILGHILGDQQGVVVKKISDASGLPPASVAALLPALAPVLMSALGTIKQKNGLDANGVAQLVQSEHKAMSGPTTPATAPGSLDLGAIGGALMSSGLLGQLFGR